MNHDETKAMLILDELTNRLPIPTPYLENSEAKVCVEALHAIEGGYKGLWYTAIHNGTTWELFRRTDVFSIKADM